MYLRINNTSSLCVIKVDVNIIFQMFEASQYVQKSECDALYWDIQLEMEFEYKELLMSDLHSPYKVQVQA